jgi:hypothetical protein
MTNIPPIFIVGVHRSGTTLLRYMLSSSPAIYIPPESDFIPRFFGRRPDETLGQARVASILETIFGTYRFVREWQGDPPHPGDFYRQMASPTPAGFLDLLYGSYARQNGAVRWGDKTPIYASYIDLIHRIFPAAQFVHIYRDGRDVALSMIDKWGGKKRHVDVYFAARTWVRRIRQAQAAGTRLGPALYRELHYESLVAEPEQHLRALCDFLGEPYVPAMAAQHTLAQQSVPAGSFHDPVRQPPSSERSARWRREMSPADVRLFQRVAGQQLLALGYELVDAGSMPPSEIARLGRLRAKYEALQAGRQVAQAMGTVPPI